MVSDEVNMQKEQEYNYKGIGITWTGSADSYENKENASWFSMASFVIGFISAVLIMVIL